MSMRRHSIAVVFLGCVVAGCAHEMGKQATEGAIESVKDEAQKGGSSSKAPPAVAQATQGVVQGTLQQLDNPEQLASLRRIVAATVNQAVDSAYARFTGAGPSQAAMVRTASGTEPGGPSPGLDQPRRGSPLEVMTGQAARSFATSLSAELTRTLGSDGRAPVGPAMSGAIEAMAASASRGVAATLTEGLPGCQGLSSEACADQRLQRFSQSAAVGFARGLRQALGWWALLAAFAGGMVVMAALVLTARWFAEPSWRRRSRPGQVPAPA
jgi:hypothetical protein